MKFSSLFALFCCACLFGCAPSAGIKRSAQRLTGGDVLRSAYVGISIYEPATGKYLYNREGDKYFVPASNTKLATCYSAMKHLGDSLPGLRYAFENDSVVVVFPTGDPSFLMEDFRRQPVLSFLQRPNTRFYISQRNWQEEPLGSGWSWNDYESPFMAERSAFPVHGNVVRLSVDRKQLRNEGLALHWRSEPGWFASMLDTVIRPDTEQRLHFQSYDSAQKIQLLERFSVDRKLGGNDFTVAPGDGKFTPFETTFATNDDSTAAAILRHEGIRIFREERNFFPQRKMLIHSQPTDSLLRLMMHRSDNFFAEQSLLMVSDAVLGVMNDSRIIDTLLRSDLKDLPQKPRWVDGSGLSRYNLFSPQDLVAILARMQRDFGMDRIKNILATGDEGTLSHYYTSERGFIYAKTGTLSGIVALSGFLYTKKNRLLIFSVLVNNHQSSATDVRRAVEVFIKGLRERW